MPIDTTHPEYNVEKSDVTMDAYKGDVLDYIPKLTKQNNEEYEAYRNRGVYFNVTKKTTEAAVGLILRKPYVTDVEDVMISEELTLTESIGMTLRDVILEGRCGMLCDYSNEKGEAYLTQYSRKHITNWRKDGTLVVLHEDIYVPDPQDPYKLVETEQYRELFLDEEGYYGVRIWQPQGTGGNTTYRVVDEFAPTIKGERLTYIPFVFVNPFDTTMTSYDPVMINIAQINISHFRSTVDLEHGVHFTALPQPWVAGDFAEDQGTTVAVGSDYIWQLEEGSSTGYLEFTGGGLKSIVERLESKEQQMSYLGGQLLEAKKGIEAADTVRLRGAAQSATLVNVVNAVESAYQQILTIYNQWMGNEQEAEFTMSRDFSASILTPLEMKALMDLYMMNGISQETFLENLFAGEITSDVQEEIARLKKERDDVQKTSKEDTAETP